MDRFTAHPIRLDDGSITIPSSDWEMSVHPTFVAARAILEKRFDGQLSGRRIVDLGCLEGGFAVEFARLGMRVTGIEVRRRNFEKCETARVGVNLPSLTFIHDDCWNVENYGKFDVNFCCGLLYHLAEPRRYLHLLARQSDVLILDTSFATEEPCDTYPLGEIVEHEGLRGRWFREYFDGDDTFSEDAVWGSWGNKLSFWPMKDDLIRAVREAGFHFVQPDLTYREPVHQRTLLAAFRRGPSP